MQVEERGDALEPNIYYPPSIRREILQGAIDMLPLCLAVLPWGILAGSMAVEVGLTQIQGVAMSAIVFAGAAQLVSFSLIKTGAGLVTILVSVFFITIQHWLYALTLRDSVKPLKPRYRLPIGFLLSDELFALLANKQTRPFPFHYAFGAGFCFYIFWVAYTAMGVLLASSVDNLQAFHLDFSIVATFIAIVVPMVKNLTTLTGVVISLVLSMVFSYLHLPGAVILAGLGGMFSAALISQLSTGRRS